jgi:hypothetical protein
MATQCYTHSVYKKNFLAIFFLTPLKSTSKKAGKQAAEWYYRHTLSKDRANLRFAKIHADKVKKI